MAEQDFPISKVAQLAKLAVDENDAKLQEDFADIMQLIDKIKNYPGDNNTISSVMLEPEERPDVAASLNRRGRNILLATDSVGMKYYSVPIVIDEE